MFKKGLLNIVFFFVALNLSACSCISEVDSSADSLTFKDSIYEYDYIFVGKVLRKEVVKRDSMILNSTSLPDTSWDSYGLIDFSITDDDTNYVYARYHLGYKVSFSVFKSFKGEEYSGRGIIYTGLDASGSCGFPFNKGNKYLVYSKYDSGFFGSYKNVLFTNKCFLTKKYNKKEASKLDDVFGR